MTTALRTAALPGVSFNIERPARNDGVPTLDVAAFVGFATSGPIGVPVLVDTTARFREIFGVDVTIGEATPEVAATRSLLGPTVELFFTNGGRACWIVRVGEDASASVHRCPGLLGGGSDPAQWQPLSLTSRSPGSSLDQTVAAATLQRQRLARSGAALAFNASGGSWPLARFGHVDLGRTIEFAFSDGTTLWVPVTATDKPEFSNTTQVSWNVAEEFWHRPALPRVLKAPDPVPNVTIAGTNHALSELAVTDDQSATLTGSASLRAVKPGDIVRFAIGAALYASVVTGETRRSGDAVVVSCWPTVELLDDAAGRNGIDRTPTSASLMSADLFVRSGGKTSRIARNLDFHRASPRWIGALPDDAALFGRGYQRATGIAAEPLPKEQAVFESEASVPRCPLAADSTGWSDFILPLGLDERPLSFGDVTVAAAPALARNGLATFNPATFSDSYFAAMTVDALAAQWRQRFYLDMQPLAGMHALLPLPEVALVAVPDAAHSRWGIEVVEPETGLPAPILEHDEAADELRWSAAPAATLAFELESSSVPDFSTNVSCLQVEATTAVPTDVWAGWRWFRVRQNHDERLGPWSNTAVIWSASGPFDPCDRSTLFETFATVTTSPAAGSVPAGVTVEARSTLGAGMFEFEISEEPSLASARTVSRTGAGSGTELVATLELFNRGVPLYIRARVLAADHVNTAWSNTVIIAATSSGRMIERPTGEVSTDSVEIHRQLAKLAAVRHDVTGSVSFPQWYEIDQIEDHLDQVSVGSNRPGDPFGESSWTDFLQAHHPWVIAENADSEGGTVKASSVPVDGAILGAMALSALERGAWIAAIQKPLRGMLGPFRRLDIDAQVRLRGMQVNSVLDRSGQVMIGGIDTLAASADVLPVTVRRLLIVVRKMAMAEGNRYVFENNGEALWRLITTRFETVLAKLHERGALAGRSQAESFSVVCGRSNNPGHSQDVGRLFVDVLVAPAHPLEFIKVRLIQADSAGLVVEASP